MNINEEGKKELERLKKEYLVDQDELEVYKCQELLKKMYDVLEGMGELLDGGTQNPQYDIMQYLIEKLEKHLQYKQDLL